MTTEFCDSVSKMSPPRPSRPSRPWRPSAPEEGGRAEGGERALGPADLGWAAKISFFSEAHPIHQLTPSECALRARLCRCSRPLTSSVLMPNVHRLYNASSNAARALRSLSFISSTLQFSCVAVVLLVALSSPPPEGDEVRRPLRPAHPAGLTSGEEPLRTLRASFGHLLALGVQPGLIILHLDGRQVHGVLVPAPEAAQAVEDVIGLALD